MPQHSVGKCFERPILCLLLVGATSTSYVQTAQQLSGRVSDSTGTEVPNTKVTATNQETAVVFTLRSSHSDDWGHIDGNERSEGFSIQRNSLKGNKLGPRCNHFS